MKDQSTQVLSRLKAGNKNFIKNKLTLKDQSPLNRISIANRQNPFAIVLTCSDSRVVPEIIFDVGIGELFVIRVAGNIANQSSIASIEYAVAYLYVGLVVVLGHQNCGAVTAAINGDGGSKHLNHLLNHIEPAVDNNSSSTVDDIAIKNACLTAVKLNADSKIIAEAIRVKDLKIIPAFYSLETGRVEFLN